MSYSPTTRIRSFRFSRFLVDLDLSGNDLLTGALPLDNSLRDSITILDVSGTDFTNSFNSILQSLPKVEFLNVGRTFMSGSIPTDIGDLVPNLQHLHLSWNNGIEGTIPTEIGNLSNLGT